jgi:NAD(P)H-flavin reductase/ferredoxin
MTTHEVHLTTLDGQTLDVTCDEQAWVLDAAADAGYTLPSLCGKGTCGGCVARVVEGRYELGEHEDAALPRRGGEVIEGGTLLCRTRPLEDLKVVLPYERSRVIDGAIPERGAAIVGLERVAPHTVHLTLQLEEHPVVGAGLDFEPGQFMEVEIPGTEIRRAYSLANPPNWDGRAEFLIHLRPDGAFSTWLAETAAVGDELLVRGPQGAFGLRDNGIRPRWFVAGGMGLAPMLSMMRRMAEWSDPQPVRLFLGVGSDSDVPELPELAEAGALLSGFDVTTSVWQPGPDWAGEVGTPVDALKAALADGDHQPDIYLCGPPAMVDAGAEVARNHGLGEANIVIERYLPSSK